MIQSKLRIGIDPGKGSFICYFIDEQIYFEEIPMIGKEIDIQKLNDIVERFNPNNTVNSLRIPNVVCVLEDVHAVFGSAAKATWEFGRLNGMLEALLTANRVPFVKVAPKKWQSIMWEGIPIQQKPSSTGKTMKTDTKVMSLHAAKRLFPDLDLRRTDRCKIADHNKVDALLIAEYCRRKF